MTKWEVVRVSDADIMVDVSLIMSGVMMFNVTEIATRYDKDAEQWFSNEDNIAYIEAASSKYKHTYCDLVLIRRSGRYKGTWLHNKLIMAFAIWCNPVFAVALEEWIEVKFDEAQVLKGVRRAKRKEADMLNNSYK